MGRELTTVETNVIRAIHVEVGTKALIELLVRWACDEVGVLSTPAKVQGIADHVVEWERVARLDAQARGVEAQVEFLGG